MRDIDDGDGVSAGGGESVAAQTCPGLVGPDCEILGSLDLLTAGSLNVLRGNKYAIGGQMPNQVQEGDVFRCSVEGCDCEIRVTTAPEMEPDQSFVDCCGHEMQKAS